MQESVASNLEAEAMSPSGNSSRDDVLIIHTSVDQVAKANTSLTANVSTDHLVESALSHVNNSSLVHLTGNMSTLNTTDNRTVVMAATTPRPTKETVSEHEHNYSEDRV